MRRTSQLPVVVALVIAPVLAGAANRGPVGGGTTAAGAVGF